MQPTVTNLRTGAQRMDSRDGASLYLCDPPAPRYGCGVSAEPDEVAACILVSDRAVTAEPTADPWAATGAGGSLTAARDEYGVRATSA